MIGQTISHYKILEKLGEGGMGIVYRAHDITLERDVALKFLHPGRLSSGGDIKQILHEARAAARVKNSHIATIYDCDTVVDPSTHLSQTYIAMEYVEGETIRSLLKRGPLPVSQMITISLQIIEALAVAHVQGIVHRDLKPENIILQSDGSIKILDFGLAKLSGESTIVREGTIVGSTAYMSPEQIRGDPVDHRSDLFSLGVILYELLTGRKPFAAQYESALFYSILNVEPEPLSRVIFGIPSDIELVVLTLLKKDPSQRYQAASEVYEALSGYALKSVDRSAVWTRVNKRVLLMSAVVLACVVLFIIPSTRQLILSLRFRPHLQSNLHIAVLPFNLASYDPNDSLFRDGLVDIISSKLSALKRFVPTVRIEPNSQLRQQHISDIADARKLLGATYILSGDVHKGVGETHVGLKLIETGTGRTVRSDEIQSKQEQLSSFESMLTMALLDLLDLDLSAEQVGGLHSNGTRNSEAFGYYVDARGYLVNYDITRNIDSAVALLRRALSKDALYADAFASLGEAYLRRYYDSKSTDDVDNAIMFCNNAIEINKDLQRVHFTEGLLFKTLGRYDDAIREFERFLQNDKTNTDAYRELADVYDKKGFQKTAEQTYRKAIAADSGYWAGYKSLAIYYYVHGRYNEAITQFEKVASLLPNSPYSFSNLGGLYQVIGNRDKAREMYSRSLAIEPNEVVYNNLGVLCFYDGMYTEAARAYEKAVEYNKNDYRIWGNLGSAFHWSGKNKEKAIVAYTKAIELAEKQFKINSEDRRLLAELGGYYIMVGRKKEALEFLRKSLAGNPEDKDVVGEAAMNFELAGERNEALKNIRKALEIGYPVEDFEIFPGLENLREDPRYKSIISTYKRNN